MIKCNDLKLVRGDLSENKFHVLRVGKKTHRSKSRFAIKEPSVCSILGWVKLKQKCIIKIKHEIPHTSHGS